MISLFYKSSFRWIGRKRGEASAAFAVLALLDIFWGNARPIDLLEPSLSNLFFLYWALMLAGVGVRIWAAGNLQKNKEITETGIYRMLRHPLYLGTSLIYLAYFLSFGDDFLGLVLFLLVVLAVYYPRMIQEEENLSRKFPGKFKEYIKLPRLVPNFFLLRAAVESDRFSLERAYENLGIRSIWVLLFLPVFFEVLIKLKRSI